MLIVTGGGIVLMIPWILLTTGDGVRVAYVVVMNAIYWFSMIPELRELARLRREGTLEEFSSADALEVVREDGTVRYDTNTLYNLRKRVNRRLGRDNGVS